MTHKRRPATELILKDVLSDLGLADLDQADESSD